MRTLILGSSWITKYYVADTLYNDGNFEQYIQVISPEPLADFLSFSKLAEFEGDERLSYVQSNFRDAQTRGIELENTDAIYLDIDAFEIISYLNAKGFSKRVVLGSTWEVYGWKNRNKVPIDTRDDLLPESDYGQIKAIQEGELMESKLNYVILRFGTVFGPYMPHDHELVQLALATFYHKDMTIRDIPSRWLDLVYVTDVLPVIGKALSTGGIDRQVFNVGGQHDFATPEQPKKNLVLNEKSISNVARSMRHIVDSQSRIVFRPEVEITQGKGYHSQLDIEKTQKTFNYYPNFDAVKLTQFMWWVESLSEPDLRRTKNVDKLFPSLDDQFMSKVDVAKMGETMNIEAEAFNKQLGEAQELAKKDMKVEDVSK